MNIFELHELERAGLKMSPFEKWAVKVEKLLGHDLDGDQQTDGYSLDFALDAFNAGQSPAQYVASVRA